MTLLFVAHIAVACPNCRDSLTSPATSTTTAGPSDTQDLGATAPKPTASLADGFYYSILLMLAVPFLTFAGLSAMLVVNLRKHAQATGISTPQPAQA